MKYLTPIYKAFLESGQKEVAQELFEKNKDFYHPYAVDQLQKLLDKY
jgi:hypothetical protein